MGSGATLVTMLALCTPGQAPADAGVEYVNLRDLKIPIELPRDAAKRAAIHQLVLFVSTDQGRSWRQEAVAAPEQEAFPFFAQRDGVYWFNVAMVDKQGRSDPPDIGAVPPALKLMVDSRQPLVKLTQADRQADQVTVAWEVHDEQLDTNTFKLEYRTTESPTWYMAPVSPVTTTGQKRWTVSTAGPITVRLSVEDRAGNLGSVERELGTLGGLGGAGVRTVSAGFGSPPPPAAPAARVGSHGWESTPPPFKTVQGSEGIRPAEAPSSPAAPAAPVQNGPRVIASGGGGPVSVPGSNGGPLPAASGPRGPLPPVQFLNNTHVDLNYQVTKVGPSQVGLVELWLTQDDGRTWRRFADDPDMQPPFPIDVAGEGVYGFTLVVRSRAGLGKQAPAPGDAPELRIEVDLTPPAVQLIAPEADPRRKDQLYLLWSAGDRNLGPSPVTLQWAERPEGPWENIAANIANTGRHVWQIAPQLPYKVFLRVVVRDQAGNETIAQTTEPVLVDLTEPEAKLLGVMPVRKGP